MQAVREAIGQLFTYRHMHYRNAPPPHMLAVFSEPVGDAYANLLDSLGIASMWKSPTEWASSPLASPQGLNITRDVRQAAASRI
jgi:hypothetical protein